MGGRVASARLSFDENDEEASRFFVCLFSKVHAGTVERRDETVRFFLPQGEECWIMQRDYCSCAGWWGI